MVRQWSPSYFATDWQDYMQQDLHWSRGHSNDPSRICSLSQRMVKEQITPQAVRQMFELDFSQREKGTAMSREDIHFCETVESGIVHIEDLHYEMPIPFKHPNIQLPTTMHKQRSV